MAKCLASAWWFSFLDTALYFSIESILMHISLHRAYQTLKLIQKMTHFIFFQKKGTALDLSVVITAI